MTKYTNQFKLKVVQRYLNGESSHTLADKLDINQRLVIDWLHQYQVTGAVGSVRHNKYSPQFKKQVVLWYLNGNGSYNDASEKFKVFPRTNVINWVYSYRKHGDNGLMPKKKGRKTSNQTTKPNSSKKPDIFDIDVKDLPKSDLKSMSEIDKDNRIEELEIQVTALKVLRALLNKEK